jgi:hypothetical protein
VPERADGGPVDLSGTSEASMAKYGLLWLLGVPLPILLIAYLIFN